MDTYIKNIGGINFEGCHFENAVFQTVVSAPEAKSEPQQEEEAAPAETPGTETAVAAETCPPADGAAQEGGSGERPVEERIRLAIERMREEGVFKHQYDYAWVLVAMEEMEEMPHFRTPHDFHAYMRERVGIGDLPSLSSIQKKYTRRNYTGEVSLMEEERREGVKKRFIAAFRKGI